MYWAGVIVPGLCLTGICGIILSMTAGAVHGVRYTGLAYMAAFLAVLCLSVLIVIFGHIRRKYRILSSVDGYGRPRRKYRDLSRTERQIVDRLNMAEDQAALSDADLVRMTQKGSADPDKDLQELIGLSAVKEKVLEMKAVMIYGDRRHRAPVKAVFLGRPGTGKTTVAGIIAGYCRKYGQTRKNELVTASGAFLTAGPDPVRRMQRVLQASKGRVLFIDEAYVLAYSPSGPQVLALLLGEMEEHRQDMGLILAGYKEEMQELFALNQGLSSRFTDFLFFEDYTSEEMRAITASMAEKAGFTVSEEALDAADKIFLHQKERGIFANARSARQVVRAAVSRHMYRRMTGETGIANMLEKADIVEKTDIEDYLAGIN